MTITEFLEARIAEDERQAVKHLPSLSSHGLGDYGLRILAECEAKRAITAEHTPADHSGIGMESPNACRICGVETSMSDWEWAENSFPCATLQALATVYKDHPDYQQEWARHAASD